MRHKSFHFPSPRVPSWEGMEIGKSHPLQEGREDKLTFLACVKNLETTPLTKAVRGKMARGQLSLAMGQGSS